MALSRRKLLVRGEIVPGQIVAKVCKLVRSMARRPENLDAHDDSGRG